MTSDENARREGADEAEPMAEAAERRRLGLGPLSGRSETGPPRSSETYLRNLEGS
jgi:hypothetical protein